MTRRSFFALLAGVPWLAQYQQLHGFTAGTSGHCFDFGAGTLVMIHGREKITPEASQIEAWPDEFHLHAHREIWDAMRSAFVQARP